MLYADASVLLATVLEENNSALAGKLLSDADELAASEWLVAEIASALGIKERRGDVSMRTKMIAFSACRSTLATGATMLPVTDATCRMATSYIERVKLRGGDALHLAIAAMHDATLWTLDRSMAEAGQQLGLGTQLLR